MILIYAHINAVLQSQDNTRRLFTWRKPFISSTLIDSMLAAILTKDNLEWIRYANKYVEHRREEDQGFYKEYDFVVESLMVKLRYHKD